MLEARPSALGTRHSAGPIDRPRKVLRQRILEAARSPSAGEWRSVGVITPGAYIGLALKVFYRMLLLLIRHAQAAQRDDGQFPDDSIRPLVPKGRKTQGRMSRRLRRLGLVPTSILSSPWKRAWQTAGILARETGLGKKQRTQCPALATEPRLEAIAEAVGAHGPDDIVALVGHEPWMSELASQLLSGSPTRLAIDFPKSGVLGIEAETVGAASGRLKFFLVP